ncbi:glycoside hydrolase family 43 protein [Promicromonospora sp. NPDC019610]|uniref:glycoside hydrolase family 43 protein n=1 Tax=Promicromonospora sp. NPDC019610 TaxID=3364405 RepID=UPI0037B30245
MATNPVYGSNFPDPAVLEVDGTYWAYATKNRVEALPVLRSRDLVRWEPVGDAMPELASWVEPGLNWAPEVAVVGDRYVAYYTAHDKVTDVQAVGVAVADEPYGPFRDDADRPLLCQDAEGGSIDASPFTDADGSRWLLWKNDGNHVGVDTWIYVQRLSDDGLRLEGEPERILKQDQEWEGTLVEGPYVWPHAGSYYLFYSGNAFDSDRYGVGYAVAEKATGPYVKPQDGPIMVSNEVAAGPGHGMVVERDGRTWYVHHAWPPGAVNAPEPGRQMWLTELVFEPAADGGPDVPKLLGPQTDLDLA